MTSMIGGCLLEELPDHREQRRLTGHDSWNVDILRQQSILDHQYLDGTESRKYVRVMAGVRPITSCSNNECGRGSRPA